MSAPDPSGSGKPGAPGGNAAGDAAAKSDDKGAVKAANKPAERSTDDHGNDVPEDAEAAESGYPQDSYWSSGDRSGAKPTDVPEPDGGLSFQSPEKKKRES